jgi:anaerobic selenocysteine-containing dehydrogenase
MKFESSVERASKKYPFKLILRPDPNCYRNLSLSLESRGFAFLQNSSWILMNPEDAKKLGYRNGDPLILESSNGKIEGQLKLSDAIPQGLIESQFLWNENPRFSGFDIVFPLSKGHYPLKPIPVKVKRGK